MSKLSFRARALDASKPMPIYMAEELPDLPEYSAINRAVPQMPSGMEKEEECEHHLQRAICAGLIIPTPEVSQADMDAYDKLYPPNYKQPRQLIHMQPFAMEQDIPDYDMDSEDERWLVSQAKKLDLTPLKFEEMMDRLEKSSGQTVVTLNEAKALLKEDDDLIIAVFDYWLNKRLKTQHPLILSVKTEHRAGSAANNPYLAFRRRTEKMQTRKNRKNDETSYEKMLKLRRDLSRAVTLLELVKRREKTKREYLHLTIEVYEKRYQAQDFSGAMLAEVSALKASRPAFTQIFQNHYSNQSWANKTIIKDEIVPRKEKRQYKKKKHKNSTHGRLSVLPDGIASSDEEEIIPQHSPEPEETEDEGQFVFRRNKLCNYQMPISNGLGNWPWCPPHENGLADRKYRYTLTSAAQPRRCIGFARRRLGRGGRVILDRVSTDLDDVWRQLDFSITVQDSHSINVLNSTTTTTTNSISVRNHSVSESNSAWFSNSDAISSSVSGYGHGSGSGSDLVTCEVKKEVFDRTEVCDNTQTQDTAECDRDKEREERDEMQELFREIRRDWLHFIPKTPAPSSDDGPCLDDSLLSPCSMTPITIELQNLQSSPSTLLDDSLFTTTPFSLHDLYAETALVADADHPTELDTNSNREANECESVFDPTLDRSFGCSRFHVVNGGANDEQFNYATTKKHSILSSTLTSPKYNSVNVSSSSTLESHSPRPKHTIINHVSNGPLTHSELMSSGRKGNKMQHNAYNTSGMSSARGGCSVSATSTLISERNVRLAAHTTVTTTHNTLNSHSANILDITSLSNANEGNNGDTSKLNIQCKDNNVTSSASATTPANKQQTIVRKNNSLPMEVT